MERLFKSQYLTVALVMAICLVLMTLVLPRIPDKMCDMPFWALIFAEYLFVLVISICAQLQSLRQSFFNLKLEPGLASLGLVFLVFALGVIVSPINTCGADGAVSIGVVQLAIINLAILFLVSTLGNIESTEVKNTIIEEESNIYNSANMKRLVQIRMKAMHNKGLDSPYQGSVGKTTKFMRESKDETKVLKEKVDDQVDEKQSPSIGGEGSLFKQPIDIDSIFAKIAPAVKSEIGGNTLLPTNNVPANDSPVSKLPENKLSTDKLSESQALENPPESNKANLSDEEITGDRSRVISGSDASSVDQKRTISELNDFGRLSVRASAERESLTQAGTMKTIGKLLIDSQSVENIIKKAELGRITVNLPSAKVISKIRGQGMQSLLETIDDYNGVEGSMLVGADGLVIASTFASAADRDGTGVLAHGMLGNSNLVTLKLDLGNLEQMVLTTNDDKAQFVTIFIGVEIGVLAVFLNKKPTVGLESLLESINAIARS